MPNRLIHSTSPYLLQHANNPVDWFEWGNEAIGKAKKENKPILVSIGYSACHWCHVMERESFENEGIAKLMNEHFVCIKVDREERPDVDQIYMEAVQLLGINGGWPLNVFLTPEQKPFYGGTYFPPGNWSQVLLQINQAFRQRRGEIDESASEIVQHLNKSDLQRFTQASADSEFHTEQLDKMFKILESRFDKTYGGIEKAPKFVMPTIWLFLLRYFQITGKEEALGMVELTLTKMASAGLYDQVGGGFARYSVDAEWFAPHFEKMLYDNGQLLSLYAELYTITRHQFYKEIIVESIEWLRREMQHPNGGFYSALDADSEGAEGKFYLWTYDEIFNALGADHAEAIACFKADKNGNWEHGQNILMRGDGDPEKVRGWKEKLLKERGKRIRPGLDDKILAGWNAITVKGLVDAHLAIGENNYLDLAIGCIHFIENNLMDGDRLFRSFKGKRSSTGGFLEDYAFLIQAYLILYQATFEEKWIQKAEQFCGHVIQNFYDEEQGYFHYSSKQAEQLIARKKEIFDNVIPSSNSVMAHNLFHLGILLDKEDWVSMARQMVSKLVRTIEGEPSYLSNWGILLAEMVKGMAEVAIVGDENQLVNRKLRQQYLPFALLTGTKDKSQLPLLMGKEMVNGKTTIFVCYNKICKLPVTSVEDALAQLSL